jgi:hypothetical protein
MLCSYHQIIQHRIRILPEMTLFPVSPHYVCHDEVLGEKKILDASIFNAV